MPVSPLTHLHHARIALQHAVTPRAWRGVLRFDVHRAGFAVPLRVGAAVAVVFVVGGLLGARDVVGFAALGALVAAFCRPDPYPVRLGRLIVLGVGITTAIGVGAALGVGGWGLPVEVAVVSLLAAAAVHLVWALHIVGPGAVVFMFGAVGAQSYATTGVDVLRAVGATACGAVLGVVAAMAPWFLALIRREASNQAAAQRESLWVTLTRAPHRTLVVRAVRVAIASAVGASVAIAFGLGHPMWAAMGAVAAMQGIDYHVTIHRGIQRLLGSVVGAVLAAVLLALPLGYWGTAVAIIVFQTAAEIASTVNYALTSVAVTPMALLMTGLGAGLTPYAAVDRIFDTAVGVMIGIAIAALTISGVDVGRLRGPASA